MERCQRWNFASVVPCRQADFSSSPNSVRGFLRLQAGGPVSGSVCFAKTELSEELAGAVDEDGNLVLRVGSLELTSEECQCRELAEERGGYLDLWGWDEATGKSHAWRLYMVIAAEEVSAWADPQEQFMALLMGTHPRLGADSPVAHLDDNVLRTIRSFVKTSPRWSDLEEAVEEAELHVCQEDEFSPAELVYQYRAFLALKVAHQDWPSLLLSPPMIDYEGKRLVDEVWHLHLSMGCYEEDCQLLTGGHVIEHQPVLLHDAMERYEYTYALHCERCAELGEEVDERCWPDPDDLSPSSLADNDGWNSGCC